MIDLSLLAFVALTALTAMGGGVFRPGQWYENLNHPSWRPPNWLFAPVWFVLYAMIAVSAWLVWSAAGPDEVVLPMVAFGAQLVLNFAWSAIFFGLRRLGLAFAELGLLWLSIVAMIALFAPIDEGAAWLLAPYLAWVTFAGVLNFTVWRLNPDGGRSVPAQP